MHEVVGTVLEMTKKQDGLTRFTLVCHTGGAVLCAGTPRHSCLLPEQGDIVKVKGTVKRKLSKDLLEIEYTDIEVQRHDPPKRSTKHE